MLGRCFPSPLEAKVPEIIVLFWVIKILTTAGGEATSDYLKTYGNLGGGGTEVALFVIAIVLQFATRRYRAFAYGFLAFAIAIAGTGISDFLHLDVHIPYAGRSILWAVILAAVLWTWHRSEGTQFFLGVVLLPLPAWWRFGLRVAVLVLVVYLALARPDIQRSVRATIDDSDSLDRGLTV